jgi:hypothetical protein
MAGLGKPPAALTMSHDAACMVLSFAVRDVLPAGSGLRISLNPVTDSLSMGMAHDAEPADEVVTRDGARLFLAAGAVRRTKGRRLCARITDGESTFYLDP